MYEEKDKYDYRDDTSRHGERERERDEGKQRAKHRSTLDIVGSMVEKQTQNSCSNK